MLPHQCSTDIAATYVTSSMQYRYRCDICYLINAVQISLRHMLPHQCSTDTYKKQASSTNEFISRIVSQLHHLTLPHLHTCPAVLLTLQFVFWGSDSTKKLQHGSLCARQSAARPQSHSSPSSTTELPQNACTLSVKTICKKLAVTNSHEDRKQIF